MSAGGYGAACRSLSLEDPPTGGVDETTVAQIRASRESLPAYWVTAADWKLLPPAVARELYTLIVETGANFFVEDSSGRAPLFTRKSLASGAGAAAASGERPVLRADLDRLCEVLTLETATGRSVVRAALEYLHNEVFVKDCYRPCVEFLAAFDPLMEAARCSAGRHNTHTVAHAVASARRELTDREMEYVYETHPSLRLALKVFRGYYPPL
jgi:hypothetical protein